MWMSQPQKLREYQEKTRENIRKLMGWMRTWRRLGRWIDSACGLREKKILRRGSMKFWICVSLALAAARSCRAGGRAVDSPAARASAPAMRHMNETQPAGSRPGRDTFAIAQKRFKVKY